MGILNDVATEIIDIINADTYFVTNPYISVNSVDFDVENMILTELSKNGICVNINPAEIFNETTSYISQNQHRDLTLGGTIDVFEQPVLNKEHRDKGITGHETAQQIVASLDNAYLMATGSINLPGLHCISLKNTSHLVHSDNTNSMNIVRWTIVWTATKSKVFSA